MSHLSWTQNGKHSTCAMLSAHWLFTMLLCVPTFPPSSNNSLLLLAVYCIYLCSRVLFLTYFILLFLDVVGIVFKFEPIDKITVFILQNFNQFQTSHYSVVSL